MSTPAQRIDELVAKVPGSKLAVRVTLRARDTGQDEWLAVSTSLTFQGRKVWYEWCWSSGTLREDGTSQERQRSRAQSSFAACVTAAAAAFTQHTLLPETVAVDWNATGRKAKKVVVDVDVRAPATQALCEAFGVAFTVAEPTEPPPVESQQRDEIENAHGIVSVWANADLFLDEECTDDDDDRPVDSRWLEDTSRWESGDADELRRFSGARSFAPAVLRSAEALGVRIEDVDVLFNARVAGVPGKRSSGWFLGSFPYVRGAARTQLTAAPDMVSIWIDTILDPKGRLDGVGGPVGWFDHDAWECDAGAPATIIPHLSRAAGFAVAALERVRALGLEGGTRVDALYDVAYAAAPGKLAGKGKGWFLGTFPAPKAGTGG